MTRWAPAFLSIAILMSAAACSYGNRVADRSVSGPLNALALAPVRPREIAVLAGDKDEKSVSVFFDTPGGAEQARFPVSKYATQIRAQRAAQGFLLAIAPPNAPGAIEQWTADGDLKRTIVTPQPVLDLTDEMDGSVYALSDTRRGRVALGIRLATGKPVRAVPLPNGTSAISLCYLAGRHVLLADVGPHHTLTIVPVNTGEPISTSTHIEHFACLVGRESIVGIEPGPLARNVTIVTLHPGRDRFHALVAPPDTIDLATGSDGTIFLLRVTGTESRIDVWHPSDFKVAATR